MTPEELMRASREQARAELDGVALGADASQWGSKTPYEAKGFDREVALAEFDNFIESLPEDSPAEIKTRVTKHMGPLNMLSMTEGEALCILSMSAEEYFALQSTYKQAWEQIQALMADYSTKLHAVKMELFQQLPPGICGLLDVPTAVTFKKAEFTGRLIGRRRHYEAAKERAKAMAPANPAKVKKQCTACLLTKPLTEFHTRCDRPDGRENRCKECRKARIKSIKRSGA